jgi:signal transduction histidine kinase
MQISVREAKLRKERAATRFAPAEREPNRNIEIDSKVFADAILLGPIVNGIPNPVVVLNRCRQIVFANEATRLFLDSGVNPFGLRPGEALGCVHSVETEGGCGTTEFCSTCGAVKAILSAQAGRPDVQECRITRSDRHDPLDLRVWTIPLPVGLRKFTVFSMADISDEKRRYALQRIFFHDVLNAAGGLRAYAKLLDTAPQDKVGEFTKSMVRLSEDVVEEIQAQRDLVLAENNELAVRLEPVDSMKCLERVVETYSVNEAARSRNIVIHHSSASVKMVSDRRLLLRVLGNMVKNALEASEPGDTVVLSCSREDGTVTFSVHNPTFIPRNVQLQIFQRSFTTKGPGRGIGTYSMKLLTERYLKGKISFRTSPGKGTTFSVALPVGDAEATILV